MPMAVEAEPLPNICRQLRSHVTDSYKRKSVVEGLYLVDMDTRDVLLVFSMAKYKWEDADDVPLINLPTSGDVNKKMNLL